MPIGTTSDTDEKPPAVVLINGVKAVSAFSACEREPTNGKSICSKDATVATS